jgi:ABC-type antimicrobial peptide transport system permease subunit
MNRVLAVGAVCLSVVLLSTSDAKAGMFDAIKSIAPEGATGISKQDIQLFFDFSKKADDLQQSSVDKLASMLLNKEESEKIERELKAAQAVQDPKEKEAAIAKVHRDKANTVEQAAKSKMGELKMASLDNNQKKLAGAAISNLFLSTLANKSALETAQGVLQKLKSSPAAAVSYATELPRIKDAVVALPGKIEKLFSIANHLVKLAKSNNIAVTIPKSASEKAQEVDI